MAKDNLNYLSFIDKDELKRTVEKRIVKARLIEYEKGIYLEPINFPGLRKIKVHEGEYPEFIVNRIYPVFLTQLPNSWEYYRNERDNQKSANINDHNTKYRANKEAYGRVDWVDPKKNMWMNFPYNLGSFFQGEASAYLGTSGIILKDKFGFEAKIFIRDLEGIPGVETNKEIQQIIHIGDQLEGVITGVDTEDLILKVSIGERYRLKQEYLIEKENFKLEYFRNSKHFDKFIALNVTESNKNDWRIVENESNRNNSQNTDINEQINVLKPKYPGVRLLLIDDDKSFISSMKKFLHGQVNEVIFPYDDLINYWQQEVLNFRFNNSSNEFLTPEESFENYTNNLIQKHKITHVIIDWNLESLNHSEEINKKFELALRNVFYNRSDIKILFWSALPDIVEDIPQGELFIAKSNMQIALSLFFEDKTEEIKKIYSNYINNRNNQKTLDYSFEGNHYKNQFFFRQVDQYLEKLCQDINALGALWVLREREGVFSIRSSFGFPDNKDFRQLTYRLEYTPARNVLEGHHPNFKYVVEEIEKSNIVESALPKKTKWISFFAFAEHGQEKDLNRVLICTFSQKPDVDMLNKKLQSLVPLMQRFIFELELIRHVEALEKFAPLGFSQASIQHEINQQVGILKNFFNNDLINLENDSVTFTGDQIKEIQENINRLNEIVDHQLDFIRQENSEDFYDLRDLVKNTAESIMHRSKSIPDKSGLDGRIIQIYLAFPEEPVLCRIPKSSVVRPLINLLDNAVFQIKQNEIKGFVLIKLHIDPEDMAPIQISVKDTGFGVNSEQEKLLYTPAKSFRDSGGSGMGLFISKNIIQQIGGSIEISKNTRWINTEFTLKFPII